MAIISMCIALFILLISCGYVFLYRGQERFLHLTEYLRKGWPIFAPLNCFLYIFTQRYARLPIIDANRFPDLKALSDNWEVIRDEALSLHKNNLFDEINDPKSDAHYDVGFGSFYKYGWRKFYLKWYGYNHSSATRLCPKTAEILNRIPSIYGAMFSILPPNSKLTRHLDPVAVSLRYHLGLATPNKDTCYINVDGNTYSWRDGKPLLFDETYIHFVRNDTDEYRLILMCDVERPLYGLGGIVNYFYRRFMKGTIVPNTPEDISGWISKLFRTVHPVLGQGKRLKRRNRKLYKTLKYLLNTLLVLIFLVCLGVLVQVSRYFLLSL